MKETFEKLLQGAFEGGAPFGLFTAAGGAIFGAIQGWSLLPPETMNIFQAIFAIIGLLVGAIIGFFVGVIAINMFWVAVLCAIISALENGYFQARVEIWKYF